ncbi:SMI1/KNR4 family protein [Streptomyces koyangensis]|uniref:SMI1/KNR4 family protein n=1 Tax=Streptomyces koyangensis TaxID=188770 RepID=UPI003C2FDAD6
MHEDPAGTEAARWYRGRLVTGPFAPFDLAGLALLEAGTGLPLPAAYRAFLEVGGGRLEYAVRLPACAPEPLQSFDRLYRLGRDEHGEHGWGTLLGEYRRGEELWHEVFGHPGLLPVARNDGGDTLLIDLSPGAGGRLHAAVHGIPLAGYVTGNVRTEVAAGFDAYLDALVVDPEAAADVWAEAARKSPADAWRRSVEAWLDAGLPGWRGREWADARSA